MSAAGQAVLWLRSPLDERSHSFDDIQDVTALAVCAHAAPSGDLGEPTRDRCLACLVILGRADAAEHGRADARGVVWEPFS